MKWSKIMMHRAKHAVRVAATTQPQANSQEANEIQKALNFLNLYNSPNNHRVDLAPRKDNRGRRRAAQKNNPA